MPLIELKQAPKGGLAKSNKVSILSQFHNDSTDFGANDSKNLSEIETALAQNDSHTADRQYPNCLDANDRNDDGTVTAEAISRLKLFTWHMAQSACNECDRCFVDERTFVEHHRECQPLDQLRYKCVFCNAKGNFFNV